jgi:hypothetical protein
VLLLRLVLPLPVLLLRLVLVQRVPALARTLKPPSPESATGQEIQFSYAYSHFLLLRVMTNFDWNSRPLDQTNTIYLKQRCGVASLSSTNYLCILYIVDAAAKSIVARCRAVREKHR